jgi:hypothetical protein
VVPQTTVSVRCPVCGQIGTFEGIVNLNDGQVFSSGKMYVCKMLAAWVRENSTVIDDGCWKQVWAEMTDSELEDRLFTYLCLSLHTPNSHAGGVASSSRKQNSAVRLGW